MKSKVIQMGLSSEPYEDLTEEITIMCDQEFARALPNLLYKPVDILPTGEDRVDLESQKNTLIKAMAEMAEKLHDAKKERERYKDAIGWIIGTLSKGYDEEETVHTITQDLIEQGIMNTEGEMIDV